jgi:acetate kinase
MLYKRSGLLGVSGISEDMRILIAESEVGNSAAQEAIDLFVYRVQSFIGAYSVALGGLDLLVFTGTMGERSEYIRGRICEGLGSLDITLDSHKVTILHTDEAEQMKRDLLALLSPI